MYRTDFELRYELTTFTESFQQDIQEINNGDTEDTQDIEILHPDNPLMVRFQILLKTHYQKLITNLQNETSQLKGEIKSTKIEQENVLQEIYNEKMEINKQEDVMKQFYEINKNINNNKQEITKNNRTINFDIKTKNENNNSLKNEIKTLKDKIDKTNLIKLSLKNFEKEYSDNLQISKNVIQKQKTERITKLTEKQKQDLILMNLEKEIMNLELKMKDSENKLKGKIEELTTLNEKLSENNLDIQSQQEQLQNLIQKWERTISTINERDEVHQQMQQQEREEKLKLKKMKQDIKLLKKLVRVEINKNEDLIKQKNKYIKTQTEQEQNNKELTKQINEITLDIDGIGQIMKNTQDTLKISKQDEKEKKENINIIENSIEKLTKTKYNMEEKIISKLQKQIISKIIFTSKRDEIKQIKWQIKSQETKITELNNKYSNALYILEKEQNMIKENEENIEVTRKQLRTKETKLNMLKITLSTLITEIHEKIDKIKKEHEKLQRLENGELTREIETNVKNIKEAINGKSQEIIQLKRQWLRQQAKQMTLTKVITNQEEELTKIKKQISITQQKNQKTKNEINEEIKKGKTFKKTVENLLIKLKLLNEKYNQIQKNKEIQNEDNYTKYNQFIEKLKTSELVTIKLQKEIENIQKEIKETSEKLVNIQNNEIAWNKKVESALEVKETINQENNNEIANMVKEIRRMSIRYEQLIKVQHKLQLDLEMCVVKRDNITESNIMHETNKNQNTIIRKSENLKSKISKLKGDIKKLENEEAMQNKNYAALYKTIKEKENDIKSLQEILYASENQLHVMNKKKRENLEMLVHKQRQADFLLQAKNGKYKIINRNEKSLENEKIKQINLNSDLTTIAETLINDFPNFEDLFFRILAALQVITN